MSTNCLELCLVPGVPPCPAVTLVAVSGVIPGKLPLCPATLPNSVPLSSLGHFHALLGGQSSKEDEFEGFLGRAPSGYPSVSRGCSSEKWGVSLFG